MIILEKMKIEALIEQFARMRLVVPSIKSSTESETKLAEANQLFHDLYEEWLVLQPSEQQRVRVDFLGAQFDFHIIGNRLVSQVRPPAIEFPPLTSSASAAANTPSTLPSALCFGDEVIPALVSTIQSTQTTMTTVATSTATTSHAVASDTPLSASNDRDANKKLEMEIDDSTSSSDVTDIEDNSNQPKATTSTKHAPVQKKVESEEWDDGNASTLSTLNYKEQSELFSPIFTLPRLTQLNETAIDRMIKAIQRVTANANQRGIHIDQPTVRTLIQYMVTLFDDSTNRCWAMRLMANEPTFEFLVNFFFDYNQVGEEMKKNYKIPKIVSHEQPTPTVQEPSAAPKKKEKSKKKETGAKTRHVSPSPTRNLFKRPRPSPNSGCPFGDGTHTVRECPLFEKWSLEEREVQLHRRQMCINCFSTTHMVNMCMDGACKICKKRHNSMLHHR